MTGAKHKYCSVKPCAECKAKITCEMVSVPRWIYNDLKAFWDEHHVKQEWVTTEVNNK